jgi:hypothetical protein
MKHTSLYLDEELLAAAAAVLGTAGPTATVRAALENVVRRRRLESLASWDVPLGPQALDDLRHPRDEGLRGSAAPKPPREC